MSVLIKGMKMPKTCMDCPFADGEYGWCDVDNSIGMCNDERSKDCPLVALPDKHGRLVDADALIEQMEADAEHMDEPYAKMMYCAAISDVRHAPTIVEAEGE